MEQLTTTVTANGGHYESTGHANHDANDFFYIGEATSSGTSAGKLKACIQFPKPTGLKSIKVLKMELNVYARKSSDGYNGCVASVNYLGATHGSDILHTFSGDFTLTEGNGGLRTFTTTNAADMAYLKNVLLDNSTSTMWIKLMRTSGQGIWLWGYNNSDAKDKKPTLTITYREGMEIKVYTSGAWHSAEPYVYTNGVWKPANIEVYSNSTWKS